MDRISQKQNGIRDYCSSHLASIVSEGLEPLPPCVFDLDVLLNAPVIDLQKVAMALHSDAGFSRRVLHLSNAVLARTHESAETITNAVVLMGSCLFHTAVLLCAVTEFGPREFRDRNAEALWLHSVQIALVSEEIAQQSGCCVQGLAYVAGLLHEIGHLPLLTVAREQGKKFDELAAIDWRDNIECERDIFGLDHCQIGRWMAKSWNLEPSLINAVAYHHHPREAAKDSILAEIVFAAERYCSQPSPRKIAVAPGIHPNPSTRMARCNEIAHPRSALFLQN